MARSVTPNTGQRFMIVTLVANCPHRTASLVPCQVRPQVVYAARLVSTERPLCFRFWYSYHQPLLRLAVGKVDQRGGRILREVRQAGLHDRPLLTNDAPCHSLALLVRGSFQRLSLASECVFERAGNHTLLADRQLNV